MNERFIYIPETPTSNGVKKRIFAFGSYQFYLVYLQKETEELPLFYSGHFRLAVSFWSTSEEKCSLVHHLTLGALW